MAKRTDERVNIRAVADKTRKVTVSIPPALAEKLRIAAVGLGLDQGDLVACGLEIVLKTVEVRVRVIPSAESAAAAAVGPDTVEFRTAL